MFGPEIPDPTLSNVGVSPSANPPKSMVHVLAALAVESSSKLAAPAINVANKPCFVMRTHCFLASPSRYSMGCLAERPFTAGANIKRADALKLHTFL